MVAQVLQQAAGVSVSQDVSFDMLDYIVSLREGIMDAWGGILLALKASHKGEFKAYIEVPSHSRYVVHLLQPYVESIFQLLGVIAQDVNRSEGLLRASMGVIG